MKIETHKASAIRTGDTIEYYGSPRKVLRVKLHSCDLLPTTPCFELLLAGSTPELCNQYVYRYAFELVTIWLPTEI